MTALVPWSEYPDDARLCFDVYAPTENGMQTVYQISILSVGVKYTYVLCFLSGFVFIPWIIYRFKDDAKKENMLVWPE